MLTVQGTAWSDMSLIYTSFGVRSNLVLHRKVLVLRHQPQTYFLTASYVQHSVGASSVKLDTKLLLPKMLTSGHSIPWANPIWIRLPLCWHPQLGATYHIYIWQCATALRRNETVEKILVAERFRYTNFGVLRRRVSPITPHDYTNALPLLCSQANCYNFRSRFREHF